MLKIFHLVFIIFSLVAYQNHNANAAAIDDANQDDETKTAPTIELVPYTNVFDSINYDSKKNFEVFIDPHTQQLFYRPKTKEAIEELVDKIKFSESIYTQARVSKKKQAPNHKFSHELEKYLPCFKKALVEITETQRISETNLRDILSYLASLHDLPSMPDIWDAIKDTLGIYYDFTFTEKSYISLDFSLGRSNSEDWIEDTIATVNDSCKLATHLGFKLDLDKSNPKFGDVYKKAQTYKSKAAITPSDASHEYIAMLRSADSLYQLLIEGFLASEEHLTKFKNKLAKKYNNNYELRINNNSSKSELLAELIRILSKEDDLSKEDNLSEISLSEEENGNYIFDYDSTLEKYCTKITARYRRRDAPVSYTKKIKIIESKINECRGNILFAREVRKHQAPKHEDDYIFILLDEVREFQKQNKKLMLQ